MNTSNQDNASKLSEEQKQKLKKYAVFVLMGIICLGCLWLIFAPSGTVNDEHQSGFNAEIPDPRNEQIIGDRRDAFEYEQSRQRQAERMRSLHDFGALLSENNSQQSENNLALLPDESPAERRPQTRTQPSPPSSMHRSMDALHDVNRTLGSFYQTPSFDPERERLQRELDEMQRRLDDRENEQNAVERQMAVMERSLQMASAHFPAGMAINNSLPNVEAEEKQNNTNRNTSRTTTVVPVSHAREQVVSALPQSATVENFIEAFSQPRNLGFHTATNQSSAPIRNTIAAVIYTDQSVANGENVRLRLTEAMLAGEKLIPRNALLSGTARLQGERLQIIISSIEHNGTIIPVEINVFDTDGQRGIFIPNSHEINAAKEIIANMGTNAGTSVNISTDAGEQFIADMGRSAVQGVSQLFARRMREVRVNLKAGYRVLLQAP